MPDPTTTTSLLSDTQFGVLVTVLTAGAGAIAGVIKWAVGRVTKALDDNSTAHREVGAKVADSNLEHAKAMTTLAVKIDGVSEWVERHTPVHGVPITNTDEHDTPPLRGGGYGPYRPKTKG